MVENYKMEKLLKIKKKKTICVENIATQSKKTVKRNKTFKFYPL